MRSAACIACDPLFANLLDLTIRGAHLVRLDVTINAPFELMLCSVHCRLRRETRSLEIP